MQSVFTIEDSQVENKTSATNSLPQAHPPTGYSSTDNSQPSVQNAVHPAPQQSTQCANSRLSAPNSTISQPPVHPSTGNITNILQSTHSSSYSAITNDHGASTSNLGDYEGKKLYIYYYYQNVYNPIYCNYEMFKL